MTNLDDNLWNFEGDLMYTLDAINELGLSWEYIVLKLTKTNQVLGVLMPADEDALKQTDIKH